MGAAEPSSARPSPKAMVHARSVEMEAQSTSPSSSNADAGTLGRAEEDEIGLGRKQLFAHSSSG